MLDTLPPPNEIVMAGIAQSSNIPVRGSTTWSVGEGSPLAMALANASQATRWIEPEQERIRLLLDEAKSETERAAREYQLWYIEQYLTRAETVAKRRREYLADICTPEDIRNELELIRSSNVHWFEMYAWGYDPRARTPLSVVPFSLFPKQQEYIEWLDDLVFYRRASGIIEKSRDEGATETTVRWGLFNWLFRDGFSMLLSTRKEDEVDSKKNQNTLFERIRYQTRLLPSWQYPKGFDVDRSMLSTMKLANPENNNTLLGEAPVENMGRGGRVTCAMLDEFAFWAFGGYPQFRSLSQTTDSIILPSSVAGKLNQYADIAFDGVTRKFVMDWRDNPFKTKAWYDALPFGYISPKMSKTSIAQEVDRNYDAAQPGKVWQLSEPHVFITLSEFLRPFEARGLRHRFFDTQDKFKIPDDWRVSRTHDYGQSEGHDWGYMLGAQPRKSYPLHDTHFAFVARNLEPTGLRTEQAVALWRQYETELGLRDASGKWTHMPFYSGNSHEQKDLRRVLLETYGETWTAWNTDYETGIETIQDWWTPIENDDPNPFRPELFGRCRFVFVALDDKEYQLAYNERLAQHFVTMSQTEAGFFTARKQISAYHYPESELGKAVKAMRPVKEFDDIIDTLRAYAVLWSMPPTDLNREEKIEAALAPEIRAETIQATDDPALVDQLLTRRMLELRKVTKEIDKPVRGPHGGRWARR